MNHMSQELIYNNFKICTNPVPINAKGGEMYVFEPDTPEQAGLQNKQLVMHSYKNYYIANLKLQCS